MMMSCAQRYMIHRANRIMKRRNRHGAQGQPKVHCRNCWSQYLNSIPDQGHNDDSDQDQSGPMNR